MQALLGRAHTQRPHTREHLPPPEGDAHTTSFHTGAQRVLEAACRCRKKPLLRLRIPLSKAEAWPGSKIQAHSFSGVGRRVHPSANGAQLSSRFLVRPSAFEAGQRLCGLARGGSACEPAPGPATCFSASRSADKGKSQKQLRANERHHDASVASTLFLSPCAPQFYPAQPVPATAPFTGLCFRNTIGVLVKRLG